jgi:hypothetical protein
MEEAEHFPCNFPDRLEESVNHVLSGSHGGEHKDSLLLGYDAM